MRNAKYKIQDGARGPLTAFAKQFCGRGRSLRSLNSFEGGGRSLRSLNSFAGRGEGGF